MVLGVLSKRKLLTQIMQRGKVFIVTKRMLLHIGLSQVRMIRKYQAMQIQMV